MKTTVNFYDFRKAFDDCRPNNFTYEGLSILFDAIEDLENDTGEQIELDVIALCCEFCELSEQDIADSYNVNLKESSKDMWEWLSDKTWVLGKTERGNFIFKQF